MNPSGEKKRELIFTGINKPISEADVAKLAEDIRAIRRQTKIDGRRPCRAYII
jgi:hypothetical protein